MLPRLLAERQLSAIEAASVPHMDKQGAEQTVRKYTRLTGGGSRKARTLAEGLAGVPMQRIEEPVTTEQGDKQHG